MPFPAVINVTEFDGTNGFMINGTLPDGLFGYCVSESGDINGDSIDDIIIGAPGVLGTPVKPGGAYIIFGNATGFSSVFDVNNLNGKNGFILQSIAEDNFIGFTSVSKAGDVNCDGIEDIVVSNPYANSNIGQAFIIFGSRNEFPANFYLTGEVLNGENGFSIEGYEVPSFLGSYVAGIGDINADGKDDVAVGILGFPNQAFKGVFIIWGSIDKFPSAVNITEVNSTKGILFDNINVFGFGAIGNFAGDVNSDGIDDIAIGAFGTSTINSTSCVIFGNRLEFPTNLALNGTNGFFLYGNLQTQSGASRIDSAGDINSDGIDDIIIGSPFEPLTGKTGVAYVIYGSRGGFNASELLTIPDTNKYFTIPGLVVNASTGYSVSGIGDVNGDGISDIAIGAPGWSSNSGAGYVIFGNRDGFPEILNLASLNGTNGFTIYGLPDSGLGFSISSAGDINADGIDDIIIGAPNAYSDMGAAYVIFGQAPEPIEICSPTFDLSSLNGANGFIISNIDIHFASPRSASGAGDINGDSFDDIIVGSANAPNNEGYGIVYIIYGNNENFPYLINATQLNSTQGFCINTTVSNSYLGYSVSNAGDVNGDGIKDIVIGTSSFYGNGTAIFGRSDRFNNIVLPTNLSEIGFEFATLPGFQEFGISVASAGDINGDGLDDIIVGSSGNNNQAGIASVIYGQAHGFYPLMLDAANLTAEQGFNLEGVNVGDFTGWSVSGAGDINGDGVSDILIGGWGAANFSGVAYLLFGNRNISYTPLDLAKLDGSNGFKINGSLTVSQLGDSVSGGGDINADGFDDIIIGAATTSFPNAIYAGAAYVIYGHSGSFPSSINITMLNGSNGFAIVGASSYSWLGYSVSITDDTNGDGINDLIIGSPTNNSTGSAHVIFGQRNAFPPVFNVTDLNGMNGYTITANNKTTLLGTSVCGAGDINGDGLTDLIISHGNFNGSAPPSIDDGNAYVIFGRRCNSASRSPTPSITPSNSPTPSIMPSRTLSPPYSSSSLPENSNISLSLLIALPIGAFVLLALICGLYLYKKRTLQSRYSFFNRVEPIPEGGEAVPFYASNQQLETYSSINS